MSIITKKLVITGAAVLFALTGAYGANAADKHEQAGSGARDHGASMKDKGNGVARRAASGHARHAGRSRGHHRFGRGGYGGIYIYTGEVTGCGHSYRKWQATGSRYWRSRYYECLDG